jgi:hypothetical protein
MPAGSLTEDHAPKQNVDNFGQSNIVNAEDLVLFDGDAMRSDLELSQNNVNGPMNNVAEFRQISFVSPIQTTRGSTLFRPDHDMTIKTPFGIVSIKANSAAIVSVLPDGVAVYDLNDNAQHGVVISCARGSFALSPGKHVLLTKQTSRSYEQLNQLPSITHRSVSASDLGDGLQSFSSEFSILSAINGLKLFNQLRHSTNSHDQKLVNQLMKNAAIILQTSSKSGPYARVAKQLPVLTVKR